MDWTDSSEMSWHKFDFQSQARHLNTMDSSSILVSKWVKFWKQSRGQNTVPTTFDDGHVTCIIE